MHDRRLTLLGLPLVLLQFARKAAAGQTPDPEGLKERLERAERQVRELTDAFEAFKKSSARHEGLISNLSRTSPPVGTVMAFAGTWPPTDTKNKKWTEAELGWLQCDGRKLEGPSFAELRTVLAKDTLPDYRGNFLRGVDVPQTGTKTLTNLDEDGQRAVGSTQGFATALPTKRGTDPTEPWRFRTNAEPEHDLTTSRASRFLGEQVSFSMLMSTAGSGRGTVKESDDTKGEPNLYDAERIKNVPAHAHVVIGGNAETRPVNVAVNWIIKYK